jgi:hypothetical protein
VSRWSAGTATQHLRPTPELLGFYEVRGGSRSDWIAVNADPRESDLAHMPQLSALRAAPAPQ